MRNSLFQRVQLVIVAADVQQRSRHARAPGELADVRAPARELRDDSQLQRVRDRVELGEQFFASQCRRLPPFTRQLNLTGEGSDLSMEICAAPAGSSPAANDRTIGT